jgi:hypothetical protein
MGYGVGSMHSTCHDSYILKHVEIPLDEQRSFKMGPSVAAKSCYANLARKDEASDPIVLPLQDDSYDFRVKIVRV